MPYGFEYKVPNESRKSKSQIIDELKKEIARLYQKQEDYRDIITRSVMSQENMENRPLIKEVIAYSRPNEKNEVTAHVLNISRIEHAKEGIIIHGEI